MVLNIVGRPWTGARREAGDPVEKGGALKNSPVRVAAIDKPVDSELVKFVRGCLAQKIFLKIYFYFQLHVCLYMCALGQRGVRFPGAMGAGNLCHLAEQ